MYEKVKEKDVLTHAEYVFDVLYKERQNSFKLQIPEPLHLLMKQFQGYVEYEDEKSISVIVYYRKFINDNFRGVFLTRVMFSKIVPLYQYEVEYQIRNYDEKSRQDVLIGGSTCDAYDVKQRYIDQLLESVLPLYGFTLLSPKELMITLFDYKYPNELEKKPVTVGELVFGRMNWDLV